MQTTNLTQLCMNRRVIFILFLAFSSGLPLALTGSTLQAWYTAAGVNLMTIGLLTMVGQPYVYKILWAPLLDRFTPLGFLGRRRSWIMLMQGILAISLVMMAFLNPAKTPGLLAILALMVAFFSATQDIGIDAYRTDILHPDERGLGSSMNTIGYRIAMLVSSAIALILAGEIGWRATYLIMASLMATQMIITFFAPTPLYEQAAPQTLTKAVIEPFKEFLNRQNALWLLIFIIIYKICDAFALSLNTAFLIRGVHFSLVEIGSISKIVGVIAIFLGSVIGGMLYPYLGLYRSLMYFGFLQMISNLAFVILALVGKNYVVMATAIFIENFCGSLGTVAFVVFLMSLCNHRYTATQYALLSAVMALGRVFVGPVAAVMVEHIGWVEFYFWTVLIGLPALILLWWLNRRIDFSAKHLAQVQST